MAPSLSTESGAAAPAGTPCSAIRLPIYGAIAGIPFV